MSTSVVECDVLVMGTGAAGSAAALTARDAGLDVIMLEKEPVFGGTTAYSGGWIWAPCSPHAKAAGIEDDLDDVRAYVRQEAGNRYDEDRMEAFLEKAPKMVEFFESKTSVRFFVGADFPDYHGEKVGAHTGGRSICAAPIDGRELGKALKRLRTPRRELLVFGTNIATFDDMRHFFQAGRSIRSAAYVTRRLVSSFWDQLWYGRDRQLGLGVALAARLLKSVTEKNIPVWYSSRARMMLQEKKKVVGAIVERDGKAVEVRTRRGIVIATGGFPGNVRRRRELFPHHPSPTQHFSLALETNTGDGLTLGESVGGALNTSLLNPAAWMPVSRGRYSDGKMGTFFHLYDRAKPGVIALKSDGKRFVNESGSYQDFVPALIGSYPPGEAAYCYLVIDHRALRRYGLGFVKPAPMPIYQHIRSGYLLRDHTIEGLARQMGMDASAVQSTVHAYNQNARQGSDPEFGKGSVPYNRFIGDPEHTPNPCLAPIEAPPFYAVRVVPGDIGTFAGLRTDRHARVLDQSGVAIDGLYAAGADSASLFGGAYPGAGATLGPALTFGYVAGCHLADLNDPLRQTVRLVGPT
ncbi:FAD-dependent oxidoreductase [Bradyrhizobium sp. Pear77]|uniref:FAD-dependent oxidoreductase n=1 Tax=Bradyrhizobium altum TaxID=1571202 RepID=UPI001E616033|nr:FAD-dependent oxidoreductase [Bradyrhizobium altum]MCC8957355.1 FAD-dependent oxidoreductase [Bradyrhizobium altum]